MTPPAWVRARPPRRRSWVAPVLRVRPDGSVDVVDPRNGGVRTLAPAQWRRARAPRSTR